MVVSDQMPSLWPVEVEFVPGEQPSDTKLNGWALQTGAGLDKLARAVGDLWGDRWDTNVLDIHYYAAPNIANISRVIGSASLLNPVMPSRETVTVTFVASAIPAGVHQFNMRTHCGAPPYLEWDSSNVLFSSLQVPSTGGLVAVLQALLPGGTFTTFKASVDLLSTAGDFTIDTQGTVTSYSVTGTYSGSKTYDTILAPDMYDGASMNVIPNPLATSSQRCTVSSAVAGWYTITLPLIVVTPIPNPGGVAGVSCGPSTSQDIPPESYQARLPLALTDVNCMGLGDDDYVPAGFMYLWDAVNEEIVTGLTFRMTATDYTVEASGATLTAGSNQYCLVTTGTSMAGVIANMSRRLYSHDHTDPNSGRPIDHSSLQSVSMNMTTVSGVWGIDAVSPPSLLPGNGHPQYLCRYGWNAALSTYDHPTLCDNAMLGDLFMAAAVDYTGGTYSGDTDDSRKIYFGHTDRYLGYQQDKTGVTLTGTDFVLTIPTPAANRFIEFYNTNYSTVNLQLGYYSADSYYGLFVPSGVLNDLNIRTFNSNSNIFVDSAGQISIWAASLTTINGDTGVEIASTAGDITLTANTTCSISVGSSSAPALSISAVAGGINMFAVKEINIGTTGNGQDLNLTADGVGSDILIWGSSVVLKNDSGGLITAGDANTQCLVRIINGIPSNGFGVVTPQEGMLAYDTGDGHLYMYTKSGGLGWHTSW